MQATDTNHTPPRTRQTSPNPNEPDPNQLTLAHRDVDAIDRVAAELAAARETFKPFNNAREGFSHLSEHVAELWALTVTNSGTRTRAQVQQRATQLAAAVVRFLVDVADQADPTTDDLLDTLGQVNIEVDKRLAEQELTQNPKKETPQLRDIALGSTQTDQLTGFTGIVTVIADYLTGCTQVCLHPGTLNKDGEPATAQWFDEMRLDPARWRLHLANPAKVETGGPRETPPERAHP